MVYVAFHGCARQSCQAYNGITRGIMEMDSPPRMQIDYAQGQETEFILEWPYASTNVPKVGILVTNSPNFSLYSIVVFPAASSPLKHVQYVHLIITVVLLR